MATGPKSRPPFADVEDARGATDRLYADMEKGDRHEWSVPVDLIERDDEYVLRADVPGFKPDEVTIKLEDAVLTVSVEHQGPEEERGDHYLRRERRHGSASRSITLPKGVTLDQVDATCGDGMLEVRVPRGALPGLAEPAAF